LAFVALGTSRWRLSSIGYLMAGHTRKSLVGRLLAQTAGSLPHLLSLLL
jgi:hypothetical protein